VHSSHPPHFVLHIPFPFLSIPFVHLHLHLRRSDRSASLDACESPSSLSSVRGSENVHQEWVSVNHPVHIRVSIYLYVL
jgi:hypothetical protein